MKKTLLPLWAFMLLSAVSTYAQTPVWSTDIAPILYNNCASCHNPNGIGPFSLLTYNDAVAEATPVSIAVQHREMPPWPPDPVNSPLAHERLLSQQEIDKIKDWAANGTPQGDPTLAPPVPTFSANGDLPGTPDLVAQIPTYTSTASTGDVYQCFVIPSNLLTDKYITAFEAIPGNREIVHHVLIFSDTTGTCAGLDAATTEPGYVSFGGVGTSDAELIGGWVPGTTPLQMPNGFGIRIPKNADIVIQIHYPEGSVGKTDDTRVHFYFSPTPVRQVNIDAVLNHITNIDKPLYIPANQTKTFQETYITPLTVSVLGLAPHMHLIGKSISVYTATPGGNRRSMIDIPEWDFHWQGFYLFRKIMKVSAGDSLVSHAFYDNTSANHENPSDPPQDVYAGEATTDEMMLTYFFWTFYQPGDENIKIDTSVRVNVPYTYYREQELFSPYPNPASNQLLVKCYFDKADHAAIDVVDMKGRTIKVLQTSKEMNGYQTLQFNIADIPNGMYMLRMKTSQRIFTEKLLIQH